MASPRPRDHIVTQDVVHILELRTTLHFARTHDRCQATIAAFRAALTKLSLTGYPLPEVEVYVVPPRSRAAVKPRVASMRDDEGQLSLFMRGDFLTFRGSAPSIADRAAQRARRGGVLGRRFRSERAAAQRAQVALAKATVIHELGHALHEHQSPELFWMQKVDGDALHRPDLAAWVSPQAVADSLEFVAEVFTGLMLGYIFEADVLEHYRRLGGPNREFGRTERAAPTQLRQDKGPCTNQPVAAPA